MSPFTTIHLAIIARLEEKAPSIRYIDQDLGQLENYEIRPSVSWPCVLFDVGDEWGFTDSGNFMHQQAEGSILLRIGLVKYTDSNNLTPALIRPNGLKYLEIEEEVIAALHGWNPSLPLQGAGGSISRMLRRTAITEKRDDDIRVRRITFACSFTDTIAEPVTTSIPRPAPTILPNL